MEGADAGGFRLPTPLGLIPMPTGSRSRPGCLAPVLDGRQPRVPDGHVVLLRQPPALLQVGRVAGEGWGGSWGVSAGTQADE